MIKSLRPEFTYGTVTGTPRELIAKHPYNLVGLEEILTQRIISFITQEEEFFWWKLGTFYTPDGIMFDSKKGYLPVNNIDEELLCLGETFTIYEHNEKFQWKESVEKLVDKRVSKTDFQILQQIQRKNKEKSQFYQFQKPRGIQSQEFYKNIDPIIKFWYCGVGVDMQKNIVLATPDTKVTMVLILENGDE